MLRSFFRKNDCLSAKCAYLGSTDIEYIGISGDIFQCHICLRAYQAVAKSCSVQKQWKIVFMAYLGDFFQFLLCIKGSVLGRMGNIDHSRKYHMLMVRIPIKGFHIVRDALCADLSIFFRKCQHFVACVFNRACFMTAYMTCLCRKDSLITVQDRCDDRCIRTVAGFSDLFFGRIAVFIRAVTGKLLHIGFQKFLQDRRMSALAVIIYKI